MSLNLYNYELRDLDNGNRSVPTFLQCVKKNIHPFTRSGMEFSLQVARKSDKYFICLSFRQRSRLGWNRTFITTQQKRQSQFNMDLLIYSREANKNYRLHTAWAKTYICFYFIQQQSSYRRIVEVMLFLTSFAVYTIYQISEDGLVCI